MNRKFILPILLLFMLSLCACETQEDFKNNDSDIDDTSVNNEDRLEEADEAAEVELPKLELLSLPNLEDEENFLFYDSNSSNVLFSKLVKYNNNEIGFNERTETLYSYDMSLGEYNLIIPFDSDVYCIDAIYSPASNCIVYIQLKLDTISTQNDIVGEAEYQIVKFHDNVTELLYSGTYNSYGQDLKLAIVSEYYFAFSYLETNGEFGIKLFNFDGEMIEDFNFAHINDAEYLTTQLKSNDDYYVYLYAEHGCSTFQIYQQHQAITQIALEQGELIHSYCLTDDGLFLAYSSYSEDGQEQCHYVLYAYDGSLLAELSPAPAVLYRSVGGSHFVVGYGDTESIGHYQSYDAYVVRYINGQLYASPYEFEYENMGYINYTKAYDGAILYFYDQKAAYYMHE